MDIFFSTQRRQFFYFLPELSLTYYYAANFFKGKGINMCLYCSYMETFSTHCLNSSYWMLLTSLQRHALSVLKFVINIEV